jgi:uncharacterized protein
MTGQNAQDCEHYPPPQFDIARHVVLWGLIRHHLDSTDLAHDQLHVLRVYHWAIQLAPEAGGDADLCGAAALLHDFVNVPKESELRSEASEQSALAGAEFILSAGYTKIEQDEIIKAIRTCSWSKGAKPLNPEGLALQEADRLDAIGAIGVMRNIACAQAMRLRGNLGLLYHPIDPKGTSRVHNDRSYAIDHFPVKLLRIAEKLTLPSAVKEGQKRHAFMLNFLEVLTHEIPEFDFSDRLSKRRH